jgi:hypothetical protein
MLKYILDKLIMKMVPIGLLCDKIGGYSSYLDLPIVSIATEIVIIRRRFTLSR